MQFFGSVPERAWIHEKRIVVYQGASQFDELQAETLRKTTNPTEKQKVSHTSKFDDLLSVVISECSLCGLFYSC